MGVWLRDTGLYVITHFVWALAKGHRVYMLLHTLCGRLAKGHRSICYYTLCVGVWLRDTGSIDMLLHTLCGRLAKGHRVYMLLHQPGKVGPAVLVQYIFNYTYYTIIHIPAAFSKQKRKCDTIPLHPGASIFPQKDCSQVKVSFHRKIAAR